jgi:Protein of unknown function (DUF2934)
VLARWSIPHCRGLSAHSLPEDFMDVTPERGSTKRPRVKIAVKPKVKADSAQPTQKPARRTSTTSRKKVTSAVSVVSTTPDTALDLNSMIATAAFYLAAERSFAPGHELEDWLEAERRIRARHST